MIRRKWFTIESTSIPTEVIMLNCLQWREQSSKHRSPNRWSHMVCHSHAFWFLWWRLQASSGSSGSMFASSDSHEMTSYTENKVTWSKRREKIVYLRTSAKTCENKRQCHTNFSETSTTNLCSKSYGRMQFMICRLLSFVMSLQLWDSLNKYSANLHQLNNIDRISNHGPKSSAIWIMLKERH